MITSCCSKCRALALIDYITLPVFELAAGAASIQPKYFGGNIESKGAAKGAPGPMLAARCHHHGTGVDLELGVDRRS